jgi:hypothetical protein
LGHAFGGATLRIFGGFAAAHMGVPLIAAEGVNRQVLLLYGALPSPVIRFHPDGKIQPRSRLGGILGTLLLVFTIPVYFG